MPFLYRYCSFHAQENRHLLLHLRDVHSFEPDISFDCGICGQSFRVFSSYTSHISRKHQGTPSAAACSFESNMLEESPDTIESTSETSSALFEESSNAVEAEDTPMQFEEPSVQPLQLQMAAATFLVTLKEKYKVTQSAVDFVVEGASNLIQQTIAKHQRGVLELLKDHPTIAEEVKQLPSQQNLVPFAELKTAYLQSKFIEDNFPYVKPVEIVLGQRWVTKKSGQGAGQLVSKADKFAYIPILQTLEALLKNESISSQVLSPHCSSDGFLRDVCDGQQGGQYPFSQYGFLQIMAYWDEIEVCNPLGSRMKIHKLAVFYFTLCNISPVYRSSLKAIYLLSVVKSKFLNEYGFEKVLKPFVDDVDDLMTNGICVDIHGQRRLFKGALQLFLADTLAAHQVGGFKVGVGFSLRKCRHCMTTYDQMQTKFRNEDFELRTPEQYDYHCSLLDGPLKEFNSTTYGINFRSPLNDIGQFHVANWQLPQDVMHVLLEGVVKQEIQLILRQYIYTKKLFTASTFNSRLDSFQYQYTEISSKPSPLQINESDSFTFHQNASQCWLLARMLPFLIGDLVPYDDEHWDSYLLLHDILAHCMAPCISPASISYLAVLIELHHVSFCTCYPDENITPKMHYMVHFPELIKRFGPPVRYWCMRMEAKNSYAKKAASCGNFKNICLSMAVRHQRLLSSLLINPLMLDKEYECGPGPDGKPIKDQDPDLVTLVTAKFVNISDDTIIFMPRWISVNGTEYHQGCYVVHGYDDILPLFGKVESIIVVAGEPVLILQCVKTHGFIEHIRCYMLDTSHTYQHAFFIHELLDHYPLHAHSTFSQTDYNLYICLKWNIENINDTNLVQ